MVDLPEEDWISDARKSPLRTSYHQLLIGWNWLRLWIDYRGITVDVGDRRRGWIFPWVEDSELLFSERRLDRRWWGRWKSSKNPNSLKLGFKCEWRRP